MNLPCDLKYLKDRCTFCGGCWEWTGWAGKSKVHPQFKMDGKHFLARRVAWQLVRGPIPDGTKLLMTCECQVCINPAHAIAVTESEKGKRAAAKGAFSSLTRCKKISDVRRARQAKLTLEQAQEIRFSNGRAVELAEKFGVHESRIYAIWRGESWKDYSSPFAGLGAR